MKTTRHSPKPFTWSYSRLKNFEACPKRHWHVDIAKTCKEEDSEQLMWGNAVHTALAERVEKGTPLPKQMEQFEKWAKLAGPNPDYPDDKILVENKLAITKDFEPCGFFDHNVWFRCVADVIKVSAPVALMLDWKTGKIKEDGVQLALAAACVFAHHPGVEAIRAEFIWLKEDASSREDFKRKDMAEMWRRQWPRIEALVQAHATTTYPAVPNYLCRSWCPVKECPHNGI